MAQASDYGTYHWCVEIEQPPTGNAKTGKRVEVYAFADRVEVTNAGDLILWRQRDGKEPEVNVAFPCGRWTFIYAASLIDGSAVAVHSWPGQIQDR